jgi:hypothetical protein
LPLGRLQRGARLRNEFAQPFDFSRRGAERRGVHGAHLSYISGHPSLAKWRCSHDAPCVFHKPKRGQRFVVRRYGGRAHGQNRRASVAAEAVAQQAS